MIKKGFFVIIHRSRQVALGSHTYRELRNMKKKREKNFKEQREYDDSRLVCWFLDFPCHGYQIWAKSGSD